MTFWSNRRMTVVIWVVHPDWFFLGALVRQIGKVPRSLSHPTGIACHGSNTFACRVAVIETNSNVLAQFTRIVSLNYPRLLRFDPRGLGFDFA